VKEGATREAAVEPAQRELAAVPEPDSGARVLELQRSAGNALVGRYLKELQRQPAATATAATQWGKAYGTRKSYFGQTYEAYKAAIPKLEPASKKAGTARSGGLTRDQLFQVFTDLAADARAPRPSAGKTRRASG
jgi:hypothetical protein